MTKEREALKLALEALGEPKEHIAKHRRLEAIPAIREALAQPEQEPAFWYDRHHKDFSHVQRLGWEPLYTTPPQRTWVGLTDEEIDLLSCEMVKGDKSVNWLCRAIEAKLKEKNT